MGTATRALTVLGLLLLLTPADAGDRAPRDHGREHRLLAKAIAAHIELLELRVQAGDEEDLRAAMDRLAELIAEQREVLRRIEIATLGPPPELLVLSERDSWTFTDPPKNPEGYWSMRHLPTGLDFVYLPGGEFQMGSPPTADPNEFCLPPVKSVRVEPFLVATTECTIEAWIAGEGGRGEGVHEDVREPIRFRSALTCERWCEKLGLRLPTEAEREYAGRGGTDTAWHCGDEPKRLMDVAWLKQNSEGRIHPVAGKRPNGFGLYDVHGNVSEWCARNADGLRVYRGGCYRTTVRGARSAYRYHAGVHNGRGVRHIGFRPVVSPPLR